MKKYVLLGMVGLLSISCNGQKNEKPLEIKETKGKVMKQPKGTWKVDKEFDENGNLIRYDSIYSWSSHHTIDDLSSTDTDSLIQHFKSTFFKLFSEYENEGYEGFTQDSLFSRRFFNDRFFESDFGNDFMAIDQLRQKMVERQRKFLEKHLFEFRKPEDEN
ncbi:hypothetical protein [Mesonia sp. K7]|uniref:hypothetical protein n=1 Tax=Mesonia sp. K7 TaxID=2218606 RepID=UPI000DA9B8FA|nr:hypothetical protein [Mesonia sp. K7]PZD77110.1 hypothetical protein DNG35_09705 [Mesonia sp. K7]